MFISNILGATKTFIYIIYNLV